MTHDLRQATASDRGKAGKTIIREPGDLPSRVHSNVTGGDALNRRRHDRFLRPQAHHSVCHFSGFATVPKPVAGEWIVIHLHMTSRDRD